MNKIPYAIVSLEVDKLYQKDFDPSDNDAIIEHCEFIRTFVESCGWTIEDYLKRMWNEGRN